MLLPTDHNKLLMQWKGPFEVSSLVGRNDYRVKVKERRKFTKRISSSSILKEMKLQRNRAVAVVKADDHFKEDMHCESQLDEKKAMGVRRSSL